MPTQTLVRKVSGKTIPVLKSRVSTRKFRLSKDGVDDGSSHDLQQWLKRKQSVWQTDNLNPFVDKEQQEEVVQVLQANDPQLPKNLVEFSFKEKAYVPLTHQDQHITLLEVEGTCVHIESPEAKETIEALGSSRYRGVALALIDENKVQKSVVDNDNDSLKDADDDEIADDADDDEQTKDEKSSFEQGTGGKTKKLMNQFNFCERATITYDNALKEAGNQTTPIEKAVFCDYATQWIIYDSYQEDFENQEKDRDKEKREKSVQIPKKEDTRKLSTNDHSEEMYKNIAKKASILERMINQNVFDDILQDFRYYEDPSDEFRNAQGTLLPLWKLQMSEIKKLCVTDIRWNPRYFDLFGVTFGTFNFQKQSTVGCICLWSLKNPSYPEYINFTHSGVMSLDFHPTRSYLIAIGLDDGMVAVYDSRTDAKIPLYESNNVDNKHEGIVWQVQWGANFTEGELMFYSISSDGNVFSWILMQNQLSKTLVISLDAELTSHFASDDEVNNLKDSGTCIALHPIDDSIFLVGTEEGAIYKCSTAYLSMYLFVYEAHQMPVQRIDYNKFNPNIFASCSADWSVKVWEDCRKEPLFVFDTASSVGDVGWAPYSSSVLAAVCLDCKVYVYDLNVDKYKAICVQAVSSKKINKLTRLSFNWKLPIIVVGDEKGMCQVLKLSPNLRIRPKVTKKLQNVDIRELEIVKLEKLLSLIREPSESLQIGIGQSSDSSSL